MDSRLLSGTVDMLILDVLARGDSYGYQIAQTVLSQSEGQFELKEGSLYPALHRLERQQLLKAYWTAAPGTPDEVNSKDAPGRGGRRKYYLLTPAGQKALKEKREEWDRFASGIRGVLGQNHVVV